MTTQDIMIKAKEVSTKVACWTEEQKNAALKAMADAILAEEENILSENALDMEAARGHIGEVMLDRLALNHDRIASMAKGIYEVVELPDPVGKVLKTAERNDGLIIERRSVPFGVIAIIYESRPNVTSDAAALALKSGNACILRGGKEAFRTSNAIVEAMRKGLSSAGLNEDAVQMITDTTRASAAELMQGVGYIDLLIPRGGAGLINACVEGAKVPCLRTGTGICHIYVDKAADFDKALNIIENAKTSRPSVCNAAEVCLVNKDIAGEFLPMLKERLAGDKAAHKTELKLCEKAAEIIDGTACGPDDFDTEFLDYKMAVKVVNDTKEACEHIRLHSTGHSD
ncbi:MAG: glutamate-5-semialdehyde dehydrogenase, partial [Parasporobacterium sp.]|nr:glutamate-5-semialdehyde dehydrogenase [Parasporobacterium sp.]